MSLTTSATTSIVRAVFAKAVGLLPDNNKAIQETYDKLLEEMIFDLTEALTRLSERFENLAEQVDTKVDKHEMVTLWTRFLPEAAMATTRERRRMLAYALAGLFTPDLETEERSRLSRVFLQLEPSDVIFLREHERTTSLDRAVAHIQAEDSDSNTQQQARKSPHSYWALQSLGLLVEAGAQIKIGELQFPNLMVSILGRAALKALQNWQPGQAIASADTSNNKST